jgi:CTP:molybdopterin cytidylyltransferase MocA
MSQIAAVVLAAGLSRRLGRPKQTLELNGETLLARAVRLATEAGLSPILTVISDPALTHLLEPTGATVLLNPNPSAGIASSIRIGIAAAKALNASGVVLMTCDQPTLTPAHLRALCGRPESITGSAYAGTVGIPAYFPSSAFDDLLSLQGDHGARHLLHHARSIQNPSLDHDIDTGSDLIRARQLLEKEALP